MKRQPYKWRPVQKQKMPAEFTDYLLEGIRKIRAAATAPKITSIPIPDSEEVREPP